MKKITLMAAILFAAVAANAAATKWTVAMNSLKGPDLTSAFVGTVSVYMNGGDLAGDVLIASGLASSGAFNKSNFDVDNTVAGTEYNVYFVLTDSKGGVDYTLTSSPIAKSAVGTGAAVVNFGKQDTFTSTASNWKSSAAPEPTSGMLLLLGLAGLGLKRKHV